MKIYRYVKAASPFNADRRREMYNKRRINAKIAPLMNQLKDPSISPKDKIDAIFQEYVPGSGKADNLGGEYARAMMKIYYRWFNDGDKFYEGYGIETCGSAAQLLYSDVPDVDDAMLDTANSGRQDDNYYQSRLDYIAQLVIDYAIDNPNIFNEPAVDMYDSDPIDIKDMETKYEYEPDVSGDIETYIDNDCISWEDVRSFLDNLTSTYGGYVESWARDGFTIVDLSKDEYDEWEDRFYDELMAYLDDLEQEYPNYGMSDDDEEDF